ncbi:MULTISPECIES: helix-turn-helix domain-containing protein [Oceanicaulis]|uniref:helix-turn-helix domain-containing protein n=1 Tax=Oceanicaulis TaxID=153232 RepID=UPI0003B46022|nr:MULTISPECIES: helix-turn-helix domain-containing protein [Oceanicaulis]HCR67346.1 XRE family transcriptional regulator [Oceanicaulis sp.]
MNWGKELRAFRQRTGLKQEAAAHLLGVSQAYVSRLENSTASPSTQLETKLERLLQEPEHRPLFEHFRTTISHSPHLISMLAEVDGKVHVDTVSEALRDHGTPFHLLTPGEVLESKNSDVIEILDAFLDLGAFSGRIASMQVTWTYENEGDPVSHWRTTEIPVRDDAGRWYLHGAHVQITAEEKQQLLKDWGGPIKVRTFADDEAESEPKAANDTAAA